MNIKAFTALIKNFFENHYQINTVLVGDQFEFNAYPKAVYPVAHIEYIGQPVSAKQRSFNFFVTIADILDVNLPESEYDIYSDTAEIANDCLDYFAAQYDVTYEIPETGTLTRFKNERMDKTAGHTFALTFNDFREINPCAIPSKLATIPPVVIPPIDTPPVVTPPIIIVPPAIIKQFTKEFSEQYK